MVARTLATGNAVASDWRYLPSRRLALCVAQSILEGTRWMLLAHNGERTWRRARAQAESFLECFANEGAFLPASGEQSFFVVCDGRLNDVKALAEGRIGLLFAYAALRPGDYHGFLVTHSAGSSQVRSATVNCLATRGRRVQTEIDAVLLRGLAES